ncbi:MAG: CDP-alcohol phosphatidyltransferase family protein [bacterium]
MKTSRFTQAFHLSMKPGQKTGLRIDLWPYYVSWPLVYLLGRSRMTPNQLGFFSQVSGLGFLVCLFVGVHLSHPLIPGAFLLTRILLDCADGQLARYTQQVSNLGGLYDLAADFFFTLLLAIALAYALIRYNGEDPFLVIPLAAFGFLGAVFSATLHSFVSALDTHAAISPEAVRQRFIGYPVNDRPDSPAYTLKLAFFNVVFKLTWRWVSIVVLALAGYNWRGNPPGGFLVLLSPVEYGTQLLVLLLVTGLQLNLLTFIFFQSGGFIYAYLLVQVYRRLPL